MDFNFMVIYRKSSKIKGGEICGWKEIYEMMDFLIKDNKIEK